MPYFIQPLKFQTAFTCGVSQCLDSAMVVITSAVERNLADTRSFSALSNHRADFCCRSNVTCHRATQGLVQGRSSCQNLSTACRNDLGIDVTRRAVYAQSVHIQLTDLGSGPACATESCLFLHVHSLKPYFFLASLRYTFSSR